MTCGPGGAALPAFFVHFFLNKPSRPALYIPCAPRRAHSFYPRDSASSSASQRGRNHGRQRGAAAFAHRGWSVPLQSVTGASCSGVSPHPAGIISRAYGIYPTSGASCFPRRASTVSGTCGLIEAAPPWRLLYKVLSRHTAPESASAIHGSNVEPLRISNLTHGHTIELHQNKTSKPCGGRPSA